MKAAQKIILAAGLGHVPDDPAAKVTVSRVKLAVRAGLDTCIRADGADDFPVLARVATVTANRDQARPPPGRTWNGS